ncbi:uncharacterized protein [Glycine max]|nr:uncharacterized protein LOC102670164 isoform X2 [Glycine max]
MGLILHPSLRFSVLCCLLRIPGIRLVKLMRRMMVAGDDSATKESFVVKKSLFSRGKHSLGRAIHQVARMGGFRNKDGNYTDEGVEMKHIVKTPVAVAVARIGDHLPEISEPSMLVSEDVRNVVYASLPALIHGRKWLMLYSTWKHGISLSTLYRRSMFWPGLSLLVVGDRKGAVFGGLVEAPLRPSNKRKYQNIHIKEKIGSGKQSGGLFYLEDDSQQTHKEALVHLASDHTQDKNQQKFWL